MKSIQFLVCAVLIAPFSNAAVLKFESSNRETLTDLFKHVIQSVPDSEELHGLVSSDTLGKVGIHFNPNDKTIEAVKDAVMSKIEDIASVKKPESDAQETNEVAVGNKKPWFCHDLNCPDFKVIEDTKDYQLREYVGSSWVTTTLTGVDYDQASSEMFMKLFGYISGQNAKKEKIKMTCPVIVRIIPGQGPTCENNFTMSFFNIPGVTPPQPTAADVEITQLPALRAYVRSFGGFANMKDYISEAATLAAALPSSAKYVKDFYYTGGYDAPFTLFHRHNEIWFIAA